MAEKYLDYWNENIDRWGDKYLEISHGQESFDRPAWFVAAYNATIGRIERRLMKERYKRTVNFIHEHVTPGISFSDLGCGTGIFVVEAARRGAIVTAVDFSESSLQTTRKTVANHAPDASVTYVQADVQKASLPRVDVTLAMGITPYLTDIDAFLFNVLPCTKLLCCQYTDPQHWASVIRRTFPVLDVRSLQCYGKEYIDALYRKNGALLLKREPFASGYIDVVTTAQPSSARDTCNALD